MKLLSVFGFMSLNKMGLLTIFASLAIFWFSGLWSIIGEFVVGHFFWAAVSLVVALIVAIVSVLLNFFTAENCEDGVFSPFLSFYGSIIAFNLASFYFAVVLCQIIAHVSISFN